MNTATLALALAALLPLCALAAPPSAPVTMIVDCHGGAWPTQAAVAHYTHANSEHDAYATKQKMLADIRQSCRKGHDQVRLVFITPEQDDRLQASLNARDGTP